MRLPGLKHLRRIAAIALVATLLVATPVLAAVYEANISVEEDGSSGYTMLGIMAAADVDNLVSEGFITATGLDTRVLAAGAAIPHTMVDDTIIFAYPIAQGTNVNFTFQTGQTPLTDYYIICGYDGYITTADNAALELGDEFELEIQAWIDTTAGADKNLAVKGGDVFRFYVSAEGELTAKIIWQDTPGAETFRPNAAGDLTEWTAQVPASTFHWDKVDEAVADDLTTYARIVGSAGWHIDLFNIPASAGSGDIDYVKIYFRSNTAGTGIIKPAIKTYGTIYYGDEVPGYFNWTTNNYTWNVNPNTSLAWTWSEIDALQIGASLYDTGGGYNNVTQIYIEVAFTPTIIVSVTAAGLSSGEYKVKVTADTTDLKLYIDDVEEDSAALGGADVSDNANAYVFGQENVLPYIDYITLDVGGVEVVHYDPEDIIVGTALLDETGAAQNGVITWGANPAGLTYGIGGFTVLGVSAAAPGAGAPPAAGGTFNPGDYVSTTVDTRSSPGTPLDPLVEFLADIMGWPDEFAWGMTALALMLFAFALTFAKFQSLMWGGASASLVVGLFVGMEVLDYWFLILIPLMVVSGLAVDKRQTL